MWKSPLPNLLSLLFIFSFKVFIIKCVLFLLYRTDGSSTAKGETIEGLLFSTALFGGSRTVWVLVGDLWSLNLNHRRRLWICNDL